MASKLPTPAPFRPVRRRRYGLLRTRNIIVAIVTLALLALYMRLPRRTVNPLADDYRDVKAGAKETIAGKLQGAFGSDNKLAEDSEAALAGQEKAEGLGDASSEKKRNAFVVASQKHEDTTWLEKFFPEWERWIYHVDDKHAKLTVPKNKGRESMVYLTFIIDNYDKLPDNVLFMHPTRWQWHNDDPDYDGLRMLRQFQLPYLEKEGYVNMRCAWTLGCPSEIRPLEQEGHHRDAVHAGDVYKKAFQQLFPDKPVPAEVAASCCAQFAATKAMIRERPRQDYEKFRQWILQTDHEDAISGRIFEYSWHMIFGKEAVHCPRAEACYCDVFGLCDLKCPDDGACEGRYDLPPFSTLPDGWPDIGWEGEPREVTTTDY